jgi:hypothetical protein
LAADSIAFRSSGLTRIRKNSAFASPFGNGGRPAFLAFGCFGIPELLNDCHIHSPYDNYCTPVIILCQAVLLWYDYYSLVWTGAASK